MDAQTSIKLRLPGWRPAAEVPRASQNAAPHQHAIAFESRVGVDFLDVAEVFKKTPYIADLKPGGRYVAKDVFEIDDTQPLTNTLLDNGFLHCDCMTVTSRTIAESLESVNVEKISYAEA